LKLIPKKTILILLLFQFLFLRIINAQSKVDFDYSFSGSHNGIFTKNKNSISISIWTTTNYNIQGQFYYRFETDNDSILYRSKILPFIAKPKANAIRIDSLPEDPNFYKLRYWFNDKSEISGGVINFAVNVDSIKVKRRKPSDFDEFWKGSIDSLRMIEMKSDVAIFRKTKTHTVYKIIFTSYGNVRITCYLIKPRKKNPKVLVHFSGYSGNNIPEKRYFLKKIAVLLVNVRGHGESNIDYNPGFNEHQFLTFGLKSRFSYSYRGAILDGIRSIDYLFTRNDFDHQNVIVEGDSQGGGLSLILASLDKRIKGCLSDIPFLTDFNDSILLTKWPSKYYLEFSKKMVSP